MGIRFQCPNGHKLNVKAELAGKRAICPNCGAKIVVPTADAADFTTVVSPAPAPGAVQPAAGNGSKPSTPAGVSMPSMSSASAGRIQPTAEPPLTAAPEPRAVWYVRPNSGGQFGPASTDVFRGWISEGRVTADSHVWREGWPEWKLACEAAESLPAPLAAMPIADAPSVVQTPGSVPSAVAAATSGPPVSARPETNGTAVLTPTPQGQAVAVDEPSPTSRYVARRRQSKRTQLTLAVVMLVVVLVLAGILVWVLRRNANPTVAAWRGHSIQLAQSGRKTYVAGAAAVAASRFVRISWAAGDAT
jgi:GYF domain 2